jgi:hypothetical protein
MAENWRDSKHGEERIGLAIFIIITGIRSNRMQQTIMKEHPLDELVSAFLADFRLTMKISRSSEGVTRNELFC